MKKIAVIGAGWYGCHISKKLSELGNDLTIFESKDDIFLGASGCNQNRLHLGYHYPRCELTRSQSRSGFYKFKKEYGFLCEPIPENIYAISSMQSKLNFDQYLEIVDGLADLKNKKSTHKKLSNIQGSINVNEEYINFKKAREYFSQILKNKIIFNSEITKKSLSKLKREYDFVIDCTWGELSMFSFSKYYECNLFHLYKLKSKNPNFAITLMDGYFFSLYPWYESIYSLTNVKNIVLNKFKTFSDCKEYKQKIKTDPTFINKHREACEKEVLEYYPEFYKDFDYLEHKFSYKTKFESEFDSRYVIIEREKNLIKVFSGKIDTIFEAEEKIKKEIYL